MMGCLGRRRIVVSFFFFFLLLVSAGAISSQTSRAQCSEKNKGNEKGKSIGSTYSQRLIQLVWNQYASDQNNCSSKHNNEVYDQSGERQFVLSCSVEKKDRSIRSHCLVTCKCNSRTTALPTVFDGQRCCRGMKTSAVARLETVEE